MRSKRMKELNITRTKTYWRPCSAERAWVPEGVWDTFQAIHKYLQKKRKWLHYLKQSGRAGLILSVAWVLSSPGETFLRMKSLFRNYNPVRIKVTILFPTNFKALPKSQRWQRLGKWLTFFSTYLPTLSGLSFQFFLHGATGCRSLKHSSDHTNVWLKVFLRDSKIKT